MIEIHIHNYQESKAKTTIDYSQTGATEQYSSHSMLELGEMDPPFPVPFS